MWDQSKRTTSLSCLQSDPTQTWIASWEATNRSPPHPSPAISHLLALVSWVTTHSRDSPGSSHSAMDSHLWWNGSDGNIDWRPTKAAWTVSTSQVVVGYWRQAVMIFTWWSGIGNDVIWSPNLILATSPISSRSLLCICKYSTVYINPNTWLQAST